MPPRSHVTDLLSSIDTDGDLRSRSELIERHGRKAFDRARTSRLIIEVVPGLYAHSRHAESPRTRATAALLWFSPDAAISGAAACSIFGLHVQKLFPLTVVIRKGQRCSPPGWLRPRRHTDPGPVVMRAGLRVVQLPSALIQAWIDDGVTTGTGLILDALREDLTNAQSILKHLPNYRRVPRRRELITFLSRLRNGIDSYLEWLADQRILNTPDLVHLERQKVFWIDGAKYQVDAYDEETKTAFEFDGKKYHNDDRARRRDIARDRALATIGIQVLRFTFEEVTGEPGRCRETIRKTIAARRTAA